MSNNDIEVSVEDQKNVDVSVEDQEVTVRKRTDTQQSRVDVDTQQHLTTEINGGVRNVNAPVIEGHVLVDGDLFVDQLGYPVFIQNEEPTHNDKYLWIQTDYLEPGGITFWINCPDEE